MSQFPYYGHDESEVVTQPQSGKFVSRPMTIAERCARGPALEIAEDIYRHANQAGVCYIEIWELISKAAQAAIDEKEALERAKFELVMQSD